VETTFQEVRAHLGVETQRQWSDLAIARTTPALLGLFSLVTIWMNGLIGTGAAPLHPRTAGWYGKPALTFSDAIAAVRRVLWCPPDLWMSRHDTETVEIPAGLLPPLCQGSCPSLYFRLYFSGGRDRPMTWHTQKNAGQRS
jgi:hypothetical protein